MDIYRKINQTTGLFIEDVFADKLASDLVATPCPGGFYWPRWDGTQWVEGGAAPEPVTPEPTIEDRVAATEAAITALMGV